MFLQEIEGGFLGASDFNDPVRKPHRYELLCQIQTAAKPDKNREPRHGDHAGNRQAPQVLSAAVTEPQYQQPRHGHD